MVKKFDEGCFLLGPTCVGFKSVTDTATGMVEMSAAYAQFNDGGRVLFLCLCAACPTYFHSLSCLLYHVSNNNSQWDLDTSQCTCLSNLTEPDNRCFN